MFSIIDLRSAYHLIPILGNGKHLTTFEGCCQLYQFKGISFGVTNGVFVFQRLMEGIIKTEELKNTYGCHDDV